MVGEVLGGGAKECVRPPWCRLAWTESQVEVERGGRLIPTGRSCRAAAPSSRTVVLRWLHRRRHLPPPRHLPSAPLQDRIGVRSLLSTPPWRIRVRCWAGS